MNWRWSPSEGSRLRNGRIAELTPVNRSSPSLSARFNCDPRHIANSGLGLSRNNMISAGRTRYASQCHRIYHSNDFFVGCDHPDRIVIDRRPWCRLLGESAASERRGTNHHPCGSRWPRSPRPRIPRPIADYICAISRQKLNQSKQDDRGSLIEYI